MLVVLLMMKTCVGSIADDEDCVGCIADDEDCVCIPAVLVGDEGTDSATRTHPEAGRQ